MVAREKAQRGESFADFIGVEVERRDLGFYDVLSKLWMIIMNKMRSCATSSGGLF